MTCDKDAAVWDEVWTRLEVAMNACSERVRERHPSTSTSIGHWGNVSIPFWAWMTLRRLDPSADNIATTVSFEPVGAGEFKLTVDLMEEHGPVIDQGPTSHFGANPSSEEILDSLATVEEHLQETAPRRIAEVL
jgi:hypothetical protein